MKIYIYIYISNIYRYSNCPYPNRPGPKIDKALNTKVFIIELNFNNKNQNPEINLINRLY